MGYIANYASYSQPVPSVFSTPTTRYTPEEQKSVLGFFGNLIGDVGELVTGVGSLIGMGVHDIKEGVERGINALVPGDLIAQPPEEPGQGFYADDLLRSVFGIGQPSVIAEDYKRRYGGRGLDVVAEELYENPLSYIADVLTVLTAGGYGAARGAQVAGKIGEVGRATRILRTAEEAAGVGRVPGALERLYNVESLAKLSAEQNLSSRTLQAAQFIRRIEGRPSGIVTRQGELLPFEPAFNPYRRIHSGLSRRLGTQTIERAEADIAAQLAQAQELGLTPRATDAARLQQAVNLAKGLGIPGIERQSWNTMRLRRATDRLFGTSSLRHIQQRNRISNMFRDIFRQAPKGFDDSLLFDSLQLLNPALHIDDLSEGFAAAQAAIDLGRNLAERGLNPDQVYRAFLHEAGLMQSTPELRRASLESLKGLSIPEYNLISEHLARRFPEAAPSMPEYEDIAFRVSRYEEGVPFLDARGTTKSGAERYGLYDFDGAHLGEVTLDVQQNLLRIRPYNKVRALREEDTFNILRDVRSLHPELENLTVNQQGMDLGIRALPEAPRIVRELNLPEVGLGQVPRHAYARARTAADPRLRSHLDPVDVGDLDEMGAKTFLSEDGRSGFYLTPNGEIKGVFWAEGAPQNMQRSLIYRAIAEGGRTTSEFDGMLVRAYERFGFRPVGIEEFNPLRAPEGWTPAHGSPPVVHLEYQGGPLDELTQRYGRFPAAELHVVPSQGGASPTLASRAGRGARAPVARGKQAAARRRVGLDKGPALSLLVDFATDEGEDLALITRILENSPYGTLGEPDAQVAALIQDIRALEASAPLAPDQLARVQAVAEELDAFHPFNEVDLLGAPRRELFAGSPPTDDPEWFQVPSWTNLFPDHIRLIENKLATTAAPNPAWYRDENLVSTLYERLRANPSPLISTSDLRRFEELGALPTEAVDELIQSIGLDARGGQWARAEFRSPGAGAGMHRVIVTGEDGRPVARMSYLLRGGGDLYVDTVSLIDPRGLPVALDTRIDNLLGLPVLAYIQRQLGLRHPGVHRIVGHRVSGLNSGSTRYTYFSESSLWEAARRDHRYFEALENRSRLEAAANAAADLEGFEPASQLRRNFVKRFELSNAFPAGTVDMGADLSMLGEGYGTSFQHVFPVRQNAQLAFVPDPDGSVRQWLRQGGDPLDAPGSVRRGAPWPDDARRFPVSGIRLRQANAPTATGVFSQDVFEKWAPHAEAFRAKLHAIRRAMELPEDDVAAEVLDGFADAFLDPELGLEELQARAAQMDQVLGDLGSRVVERMMLATEPTDALIELAPSGRAMVEFQPMTGLADVVEVTDPRLIGALRDTGVVGFSQRAEHGLGLFGEDALWDRSLIRRIDGEGLGAELDADAFRLRLREAGYGIFEPENAAAADLRDGLADTLGGEGLRRVSALSDEDRWRLAAQHLRGRAPRPVDMRKLANPPPLTDLPSRVTRRTEDFAESLAHLNLNLPPSGRYGAGPLSWRHVPQERLTDVARDVEQEVWNILGEEFGYELVPRHRVKEEAAIRRDAGHVLATQQRQVEAADLEDLVSFQVVVPDGYDRFPVALRKMEERIGPVSRVENTLLSPGLGGERRFRVIFDRQSSPVEVELVTHQGNAVRGANAKLRDFLKDIEARIIVQGDEASPNLFQELDATRRMMEAHNEVLSDEMRAAFTGHRIPWARKVHYDTMLAVANEFERPMYDLLDWSWTPLKSFRRKFYPMMARRGAVFAQEADEWISPISAFELDDLLKAKGLPQPVYFPYFDARRLRISDFMFSKKRVGLRQMTRPGYERKFTGDLIDSDFVLRDPMDAYARRAALQARRQEALDIVDKVTTTYGRRVAGWEDLGESEVVFAPDGFLRFYRMKMRFDDEALLHVLQENGNFDDPQLYNVLKDIIVKSQDDLERLLIGNQAGVTKRGVELWAIPRVVGERLEAAVRPVMGRGMRLFWDKPTEVWRAMVLQGSPRWVVNNIIGNYLFIKMQGAKLTDVIRQLNPRYRNKLRAIIGEKNLHRVEGGLFDTMYNPHLGTARDSTTGRLYEALSASKPVELARAGIGNPVKWFNTQVEEAFRRASFITAAERVALKGKMRGTFQRFWTSKKDLERVARVGISDDLVRKAIDEVNYFMNDYTFLTPFGRNVMRRVMVPFWAFYRHVAKLTLTMPVSHPARFRALQSLAQVGNEMSDDFGPVPVWAEGAVPVGAGDETGETRFLSSLGPNPLSSVFGLFQTPGQMLHPGFKLLWEWTTGRSALTGRAFSDPAVRTPFGSEQQYRIQIADGVAQAIPVERVAPNLIEHIAQQVPQYELLKDIVAGGRTYDTSSLWDVFRGTGLIRDPTTGDARYPLDLFQQVGRYGGFSTFDVNQEELMKRQLDEGRAAIRALLRDYGLIPPASSAYPLPSATQATLPRRVGGLF